MSADDYYIIKRHPKGGYAAVHWFMSNEDEPKVRPSHHLSFPTVTDAVAWAQVDCTEYGVRVDHDITKDAR